MAITPSSGGCFRARRIWADGSAWLRDPVCRIQSHCRRRTGTADGFSERNSDPDAELLLRLADIRHVSIAEGPGVGLAQDVDGFVRRQNVTHQVGKGGDADHLVRAHVVGLAWAAVLQQGEEPMGEVGLV